jgi:voltage-gated potassium channel Kch
MFYFSFVTLATLGYGDIVPATRLTETLVILEAIAGQIFLAVYIARLLGMHMAGEMMRRDG